MSLLDIVRTFLGIDLWDMDRDAVLSVYVDMTVRSVLSYCNIRELPDELSYVAARMAANCFNEFMLKQTLLSEDAEEEISANGSAVSSCSGSEGCTGRRKNIVGFPRL